MGAGKRTALAAAREAGLETIEIDELMEARARQADPPGLRGGRRGGLPGARGRGRRGAAGAGRRRRDRPRRRQRPLRAGARGARPPHRRLAADRRGGGLAADRGHRPPAGDAAPRTSSALLAERLPLYEELADAVVPTGDRGVVARALPAIQALAEMPAGTRMLWAASASGEYPVFVGSGLLETRLVAAGGPALLRHRHASRAAVRRAARAAGRRASRSSRARRRRRWRRRSGSCASWRQAGMTREDHVVALGGGVVGDLAGFCAHIYQRGVPGRPGADHARRPGRLRLRRQDRGRPAGGQELRRRLPPAGRGARRHLDAGDAAAGGAGGGLRRGAEDGPAGRRRALGAGALDRRARPRRARRRRLRLRPLQVRGRRRRRARRGPARRAQPRPHGRPRDRGGERLRALPPRRGGRARPAGRAAALRRARAARRGRGDPRAATACRPGSTPRSRSRTILAALQRDKKRTAAGVGFVLLSEPGEPRTGQLVDPAKVRAAVEELYR